LKVEALARHADGDSTDAGPGVEPRAQRPEYWQIRAYTRRLQRDKEQAAKMVRHRRQAPARD
jgi:hypothetical protein